MQVKILAVCLLSERPLADEQLVADLVFFPQESLWERAEARMRKNRSGKAEFYTNQNTFVLLLCR